MWNRRKEEEPAARPSPSSPINEGVPMQTMPSRSDYDAPVAARTATIGKGVSITGQIHSKEDLIIDGEIDGSIEAHEHKLTIGPNAKVKAGIKAKDIVVYGAVQGNVEATDKTEIRKEARLVGDIKTARIQIEDGALFKGSIDIVRLEPKPAPKAQPAPQAVPSQTLAASAGGGDKK